MTTTERWSTWWNTNIYFISMQERWMGYILFVLLLLTCQINLWPQNRCLYHKRDMPINSNNMYYLYVIRGSFQYVNVVYTWLQNWSFLAMFDKRIQTFFIIMHGAIWLHIATHAPCSIRLGTRLERQLFFNHFSIQWLLWKFFNLYSDNTVELASYLQSHRKSWPVCLGMHIIVVPTQSCIQLETMILEPV